MPLSLATDMHNYTHPAVEILFLYLKQKKRTINFPVPITGLSDKVATMVRAAGVLWHGFYKPVDDVWVGWN